MNTVLRSPVIVHLWLFLSVLSSSMSAEVMLSKPKEEKEGNMHINLNHMVSDSEPPLVTLEDTALNVGNLVENDDLDGGFSSLDGMLHWAIGNTL